MRSCAGNPRFRTRATMASALSAIKAAYDAFGRGDISAILDLVADYLDWKLLGPPAPRGSAIATKWWRVSSRKWGKRTTRHSSSRASSRGWRTRDSAGFRATHGPDGRKTSRNRMDSCLHGSRRQDHALARLLRYAAHFLCARAPRMSSGPDAAFAAYLLLSCRPPPSVSRRVGVCVSH